MTREGGQRFLAAEGRRISMAETAITFDEATNRIGLGAGDRLRNRDDRLAKGAPEYYLGGFFLVRLTGAGSGSGALPMV
jgi:hypothetical protein